MIIFLAYPDAGDGEAEADGEDDLDGLKLADLVLEIDKEGLAELVPLSDGDGLALVELETLAVLDGLALAADGLAEGELETLGVADGLAVLDGEADKVELALADFDREAELEADELFEWLAVLEGVPDGLALVETLAASERINGGSPPRPLRTSLITASSVVSLTFHVRTSASTLL